MSQSPMRKGFTEFGGDASITPHRPHLYLAYPPAAAQRVTLACDAKRMNGEGTEQL
jgi:hypothetical protein